MKMTTKSDPKLLKIYKKWLRHERFQPLKSSRIYIDWKEPSTFEKGSEAWGLCWKDDKGLTHIRLNEIMIELDAPDHVIEYIVAHEMVHMLPGCGPHNQTFWDHEINVMGENAYYRAVVWINKYAPLIHRRYYYRDASWLRTMINSEQLRVKDMAEVCDCSERTIRRWLKHYDITIRRY